MANAVVILAAGLGKRMQSDLPKVLHQVAHASLLEHAMGTAQSISPAKTVVITGHGADLVEAEAVQLDDAAICVRQDEQLGTGHAVTCAKDVLDGFEGKTFVLFGDTPFVSPQTLERLAQSKSDVTVLGFNAENPGKYGRLVMNNAELVEIVEAKDATEDQLRITLCNSGVMAVDNTLLFQLLENVGNNNASGEYYLTDIVKLAKAAGHSCGMVDCAEAETLGVNSRNDLATAENVFQSKRRAEAMQDGVTLRDPATTFFAYDTVVGRDVILEQSIYFGRDVTIETGAIIKAFSHLDGCHVSRGAVVGPYARLRPGTELAEDTKVGNFVETKNAIIAEGAKVNHLSYVGDAEVGKEANIGAGTITCNYDGVFKNKTIIGERAFIGSNTALVAPVSVGNDAMTGSGSVITESVEDEAMALARARQVTKPKLAKRLMDKLRAQKAGRKKDK